MTNEEPLKLSKADAYRFFCSHFEVSFATKLTKDESYSLKCLQTDDAMVTFDLKLSSSATDSLAPRVYIVGNLKENAKAVLKIADFSYCIDDPFIAVDTMFKLHLSMNLQFPRQSLFTWAIIEQFIYKLNRINISNSQIITIINEMNLHVSKQTN